MNVTVGAVLGSIRRLEVSLTVSVPMPSARTAGVSVAVGLLPRISTLPPGVGGSLNTGDWLLSNSVTVTPLTLPPVLAVPHHTAVAVGVPLVPTTSDVVLW